MKRYSILVCVNCLSVVMLPDSLIDALKCLDNTMVCCDNPNCYWTKKDVKLEDDELKPCPFCGGEASKKIHPFISFVRCDKCRTETTAENDIEKSIKVWNMRV